MFVHGPLYVHLMHNSLGPEEDFLRRLCLHSARLLQLIIKTSTDSQSDMMQEKDLPEVVASDFVGRCGHTLICTGT